MTKQYGIEFPSATGEREIYPMPNFEVAFHHLKEGIFSAEENLKSGLISEHYITNVIPRLTWKLPNGEWS